MTIRKKLLLLLLFPLLIIVFFSARAVLELYEVRNESVQISSLVELSTVSGKLIHELQKERGMSVGYLGSKGANFRSELEAQRKLVDQRVAEFMESSEQLPEKFLSDDLRSTLEDVNARLVEMASYRERVTAMALPPGKAAGFYTGINKQLINGVISLSGLSTDVQITRQITAYSLFLSGKDYAGIERAMLSAAFGADAFSPAILNTYVNARASQTEDFNKFLGFASSDLAIQFKGVLKSDAFAEVERLRAIATEKSSTGGFGVDAGYWFKVKTDKINLLKEVEDSQAGAIIALAAQQKAEAQKAMLIWGGAIALIFTLVFVVGRNIITSIIDPMEELLQNAAKIAMGHVDIEVQETISDELGGVSYMFQSMMENITETMERLEEEKRLADEAVQKAETLKQDTEQSETELKASVHTMLTALESFAAGDLSTELPGHQNADIDRLYKGYNTALSKVRSLIVELKGVVEQTDRLTAVTNEVATQIAEGTNMLSLKSSDAAVASANTANSMSSNAQVVSSTSEMSVASGQAAKEGIHIVEQTVERIESIAETVNRCVEVINKLGQSSQEITGIVSVIEDIAEQTNLLALNAAIEAARAGESGKGFAVVAEEVRSLSERTKDSTRRIETVVKALSTDTQNAVDVMNEGQELVNEGLKLADHTHKAIANIGENVQTMVQLITRIASSIEEEARMSNNAASLMETIDQHAQKTSGDVGQIVESLQKLDVLTGNVTKLVEIFNVGSQARPVNEHAAVV